MKLLEAFCQLLLTRPPSLAAVDVRVDYRSYENARTFQARHWNKPVRRSEQSRSASTL